MRTAHQTVPCSQREKGCVDHNDPSGTNPNRNDYSQAAYTAYRQNFIMMPDNHPSSDERILHPDKGELHN